MEPVEKLSNRKHLVRNNSASLEKVFKSRLDHPFALEKYHSVSHIFQIGDVEFLCEKETTKTAEKALSKSEFDQIFSHFKFIKTPEELQEYFDVEELEDSLQDFTTPNNLSTAEHPATENIVEIPLQEEDVPMSDFGGLEDNYTEPTALREKESLSNPSAMTNSSHMPLQVDHEGTFTLQSLFFDSREKPVMSTRKVKIGKLKFVSISLTLFTHHSFM